MQKPNSYDTTQAAGEFEPIKLGGHKMVIKQVSERQSQSGLNMIVILFDFADGDEQAGYFMKQFENDIRPDKKYPNAGTNYMVIDENVDYGVRNTYVKYLVSCVQSKRRPERFLNQNMQRVHYRTEMLVKVRKSLTANSL